MNRKYLHSTKRYISISAKINTGRAVPSRILAGSSGLFTGKQMFSDENIRHHRTTTRGQALILINRCCGCVVHMVNTFFSGLANICVFFVDILLITLFVSLIFSFDGFVARKQ
jgi:hypothetical protein